MSSYPSSVVFQDTETHRECSACHQIKRHADFRLFPNGQLARQCKKCSSRKAMNARVRKYDDYEAYLEYRRQYNKRYRRTASGTIRNREQERVRRLRCTKEQRRHWKDRAAQNMQAYRIAGIVKYGNVCKCCAENTTELLCIDHVFNDGKAERQAMSQYKFYRKVAQEEISERYQVLCFNCNWGKERFGICPHQKERQEVANF